MRAQAAFEYMVIVTLVLVFIIPVWAYLTTVNTQAIESLSISQAQTAANRITSAADLVYTQGPPTQVTLDIYVPEGLNSSQLIDTTVKFTVISAGGLSDVASVSVAPLNGSLPNSQGRYIFTVKAVDNYVNISY